jgi:transcriptional regulator with XRE-family HTH domain
VSHPLLDVLERQERTVAWLARKCGLSTSYVGRMLKGERPITTEFKAAAADVLGLPESALFLADEPAEVAS